MSTRHGMSYTRTYECWKNMVSRCSGYGEKNKKNYKDRGITLSPQWKSFSNFFRDMGRRPEGMSLDRIDNEKGYSKDNCRWATRKTQMNNQRPLRKNNKSGVKGVCWSQSENRWLSFYRGKRLIQTTDFELAVRMRKSAEEASSERL